MAIFISKVASSQNAARLPGNTTFVMSMSGFPSCAILLVPIWLSLMMISSLYCTLGSGYPKLRNAYCESANDGPELDL